MSNPETGVTRLRRASLQVHFIFHFQICYNWKSINFDAFFMILYHNYLDEFWQQTKCFKLFRTSGSMMRRMSWVNARNYSRWSPRSPIAYIAHTYKKHIFDNFLWIFNLIKTRLKRHSNVKFRPKTGFCSRFSKIFWLKKQNRLTKTAWSRWCRKWAASARRTRKFRYIQFKFI